MALNLESAAESPGKFVPAATPLQRMQKLPITDLRSQGRGGGEGCPLGVT